MTDESDAPTPDAPTPDAPTPAEPGMEETLEALDAIAAQSAAADVDKLQEENAELKDRVLRIQAELENFRRR